MSNTRFHLHCAVSLLTSLWLFLPAFCAAQTAPSPSNSANMQWSDITEVVVRAKLPGPPMWKLQKGDATVWVLPKPNLTPKDLKWDTSRLSNILKNANALYIPVSIKPMPFLHISANKKLSDFVSGPTYKRVIKTLDREYLSHMFLRIQPAYLGPLIYNESWPQYGLLGWFDVNKLDQVIYDTHVKVIDLPWGTTKVATDFLTNATDQETEYCLNLFLDGVDNEMPVAPIISEDWAQGDLQAILADFREDPFVGCYTSQPKYAEEYRRFVDDPIIDQINELLDAGTGTTVMLLPLSDVLKKGGIFDRLREDSVEITSPPQ